MNIVINFPLERTILRKGRSVSLAAQGTESRWTVWSSSRRRKHSAIPDPVSHQQPAQSKQQEAGLAPDQIPNQPGGLVAMNFSERLPCRKVQQIQELRIILLRKMMERAADHPMRAKFMAQRGELLFGALVEQRAGYPQGAAESGNDAADGGHLDLRRRVSY